AAAVAIGVDLELIIAGTARERIRDLIRFRAARATATDQDIVAETAVDIITAQTAEDQVATVTAVDRVVAVAADDPIVAISAAQKRRKVAADQLVVAPFAVQVIERAQSSLHAHQGIVAIAAVQIGCTA